MAAPRKICRGCSLEMHSQDRHPFCLMCLTTTHASGECSFCKVICFSIYSCRLGIVGDTLQASRWPTDWRKQLLSAEDAVWAAPHNDTDTVNTGNDSPGSSHGEDQVDKVPDKPTGSGLDQWKSTVESSIAGLGDSIKQISDSLQALVSATPGPGKKKEGKRDFA